MNAEAHPACADGIARSRRDRFAIVAVGGVRDAALDRIRSNRRRSRRHSNRDRISLQDLAIFNQRQLAIFKTHHNQATRRFWRRRSVRCRRILLSESLRTKNGRKSRCRQPCFECLHRGPPLSLLYLACEQTKCKRETNPRTQKINMLSRIGWSLPCHCTHSVSISTRPAHTPAQSCRSASSGSILVALR